MREGQLVFQQMNESVVVIDFGFIHTNYIHCIPLYHLNYVTPDAFALLLFFSLFLLLIYYFNPELSVKTPSTD